jgi:hypothetical protein
VQYTVSQGGLQKDTHSDTQTISAQGNVLKPIAISPADDTSQVAAECDCVSVGRDT